ncbi:MAG: potassium transporter KefA [Clostridiales bacterium]|nr:potassium transporter KefA [Clostridiales bacterium]
MNKRLVVKLLGGLLALEALLMLPAVAVALCYGESIFCFLQVILVMLAIGVPVWFLVKPDVKNLNARDGLAIAGISWLLMSFFGCLPFVFSGSIPSLADAFFETVSGFTTTGATILEDVECLPKGILFWRSFTHWIGGMGVLVLTLAILPKLSGRTSHLAKAETPGPTFSKLAPRMGDTAKILYMIYGALTLLEFIALVIAGMPVYDALIHAVSTAGTGGFSCRNASIGAYSPLIQWVVAVFMLLFGVNFAIYFHMIRKEWSGIAKNEELWIYLIIIVLGTFGIALNTLPQTGSFGDSLRQGFFNINTVMSTTGFGVCDISIWPIFARVLMVVLMVGGACAGSTAGGLKLSRIIMLFKSCVREVRRMISPRKVSVVRMEGKAVEESTLGTLGLYLAIYVVILLLGSIAVSLDPMEGNNISVSFTSTLSCISNVGPYMGSAAGASGCFAGFSVPVKLLFSIIMLAGRLEFFPMLALLSPTLWKKY